MTTNAKPAAAAVTAGQVVALCISFAQHTQAAQGAKGCVLTAAHQFLDAGNTSAELSKTAAAVRLADGGKAASKQVQAGYKLAMRYAKVAEFLEKHGLTFAAIGETIGDKKSFSINMAERATRTESEDAGTAAFAKAWQASRGTVAERVAAAEAAETAAASAATTAAAEALRAKFYAEFKAAEQSAAAAPKASRKRIAQAA